MQNIREFEELKRREEILLAVYHKSLLPYCKSLFLPFIIMPILIVIGVYLPNVLSLFTALMLGIFIVGILVLRVWYLWTRSMFLITSMRVIVLDQKGLLHREAREAYFADICQVGAKVRGLKQSLFKYGDVLVQTQAELWLEDIERPHDVKEEILDVLNEHKNNTRALPRKFWEERRSQR